MHCHSLAAFNGWKVFGHAALDELKALRTWHL
jgi:hypothetical protein